MHFLLFFLLRGNTVLKHICLLKHKADIDRWYNSLFSGKTTCGMVFSGVDF